MMAGTELKSCDEGGRSQPLTSAGIVDQIIDMPIEGSSFYNRIARRTRGVSLEFHGIIRPTLTNTAASKVQYARILIVYDRQANGALPSGSDILLDYDNGGGTTNTAYSGVNMDNRDRFQIIRDRKMILPPLGALGVASTTTAPSVYTTNADMKDSMFNYSEYIKLNGLETQYKASTGGAIGDISTGAYLIYLIQDQTDANTTAWQLQWNVRYKFLD